MPNYKEVEKLISELHPFKHAHSMRAEIEGSEYRVFSYSTLIATYSEGSGWWLNENKYSVTTSKQQNILRRVISRGTSPSPVNTGLVFP